MFVLGCDLILSGCAAFFAKFIILLRNTNYADVFFPNFYPVTILPDHAMQIMNRNSLYHVLTIFRECILYGQPPVLQKHLICLEAGLFFVVMGLTVLNGARITLSCVFYK